MWPGAVVKATLQYLELLYKSNTILTIFFFFNSLVYLLASLVAASFIRNRKEEIESLSGEYDDS
jgi:hypothetical protein